MATMKYFFKLTCLFSIFVISVGVMNADIPHNTINCGTSDKDSIIFSESSIKFKVDHKDIGKCGTDSKPYRSGDYFKPWSERAEVNFNKDVLRTQQLHSVKFDVKILRGYENRSKNETWFQIKCDNTSRVPIMAFYTAKSSTDKKAGFYFSLATGTDFHEYVEIYSNQINYVNDGWYPKFDYNEWYPIEIKFANTDPSVLTVKAGDNFILKEKLFWQRQTCPDNYTLRLGIYRGGEENRQQPTSEIIYRNVRFDNYSD